jgi:hypothetical protein
MGGETPPPKPNEKSQVLHNESLAVYAKLQIPSQPEREEDFGTLCTSSERERRETTWICFSIIHYISRELRRRRTTYQVVASS